MSMTPEQLEARIERLLDRFRIAQVGREPAHQDRHIELAKKIAAARRELHEARGLLVDGD
jgi:hypothetical protein